MATNVQVLKDTRKNHQQLILGHVIELSIYMAPKRYRGFFSSQIEREKLDDTALRNKMSDNILQTSHVMKSFK